MNHLNFSNEQVYLELAKRKRNRLYCITDYQISIKEYTHQINNFKSFKRRQWIEEQSKKNIPFLIKLLFNLACIDYDEYLRYQNIESKKLIHISFDLF